MTQPRKATHSGECPICRDAARFAHLSDDLFECGSCGCVSERAAFTVLVRGDKGGLTRRTPERTTTA